MNIITKEAVKMQPI